MRSTIAGLAGILAFAVLQALARTLFPDAPEAGGGGRDFLAIGVLGGTFATFLIVYLGFPRLKRLVRMVRRGEVVHGNFGNRRRRPSNLPPELLTLLNAERRKRTWRQYLPLWGGAVAVGMVVGAVVSLLPSKTTDPGTHEPTATIPTPIKGMPKAGLRNSAVQAEDDTENITRESYTNTFGFCHTGGGTYCVVDGDTIWIGGENVRIADIDAPETHDYRCSGEKELGDKATQRLIQLVNSGSVTVQPIDRDEDSFGRKLRIVLVDGTSVGDTLVGEGLARYYEGGKQPWC